MQSIYKKYFVTLGILWACCLAVFAAVYFFMIEPQNKSVLKLRNEFAQKQIQFNRAYNAEADVKALSRKISELGSEINIYAADQTAARKLAFDIGQFANKLKVNAFSCRVVNDDIVSAIPKVNNLWALNLNLSFDGKFNQFAQFLNSLERHTPVLFIDRFTVTQASQEDKDNQIHMAIAAYVSKCRLDVPKLETVEIPVNAVTVSTTENNGLPVAQ